MTLVAKTSQKMLQKMPQKTLRKSTQKTSKLSYWFHPTASPHFSNVVATGFELVFEPLKRILLGGVHVHVSPDLIRTLDPNRPVLLYGNHASNWDGFLFRSLQKHLRPGVPIYSLMKQEELTRLPLFRWLGGLGIDPAAPVSVARSIRLARVLRKREDDFFFSVFPQGSTFPPERRPLGFHAGIRHFANALLPVTMLPVGLHFELCGGLRPHAFVSVGEPSVCDREEDIPSLAIMEAKVTVLLDALQADLCRRGEAAMSGTRLP